MDPVTQLGVGADPIESMDWLREFGERYLDAWNSHDPAAVAACVAEDVVWEDPALPEPARGRDGVEEFVRVGTRAFPDFRFTEPGEPAISADGLVAYVPWRMTGTHTGPLDPPGFAPTGRSFAIDGVDLWRFRGALIWRYRAVYDSSELGRQLGLVPSRGGAAEQGMVRMQRLRARLPL